MNKKTATYTRQLDVRAYQSGKLFAKFYGVSRNASVYVDDVLVGTHVGGYSAFAIDLTEAVQGKTSVTLKVEVTNVETDSIPINVDYTQWAGIYRDVELVHTAEQYVSLEDYGSTGVYVDSSVEGDDAAVSVRTELTNAAGAEVAAKLKVSILDASGREVASTSQDVSLAAEKSCQEVASSLAIEDVHLWNGTADPYLYTAKVTLLGASGATLDEVETTFGVRTFTVSNGASYLNGKAIEIHGVGYHQDREGQGNAVTREQMQEDVDTMLDMGVNAVRTSHYPHDRQFYEMCDETGLLVYSEIPYYLIYSKAQSYRDSITNQIKEMIRQGYNNPSIVMWGVENEVYYSSQFAKYGTDFDVTPEEIVAFNKSIVELAQAEDASRLVVQATIDGYDRAEVSKLWSGDVDLTGVNLYRGWYVSLATGDDAGRSALEDDIAAAIDHYKELYGVDSLMLSEYGCGGNIAQHCEVDGEFTFAGSSSNHYEEYQSFVLEAYWDVISRRSDVAASFVWNMFEFSNYRTEGGMTRINTKGIVCYDHSTKKDAYYFFKANWNEDDKFVYLTSKRFTVRNKLTQSIKAYSNCESCELFVNGTSVGTGRKQQSGVFVWDNVSLDATGANSLRVVATSGGKTYEDSVTDVIVQPTEYRLYNSYSGEHFFTASLSELNTLVAAGWTSEGEAWRSPATSGTPVYRLYNPFAPLGEHHYTTSEEEMQTLVEVGWVYEGIGWYSAESEAVPIYRLYNPNALFDSHHYTRSADERDQLVSLGWVDEGVGWYAES